MKRKKTKKGMTLIEIIISLAIFSMLGVVLVQAGTLVDRTNKATSRLNKKVNAQSPYAASQNTEYHQYDTDGNLMYDGSGNPIYGTLSYVNMDIEVYIDENNDGVADDVSVKYKKADGSEETKVEPAKHLTTAKRYTTEDLVINRSNIYDPNGPNKNHNLKFAVFDNENDLGNITMAVGDPAHTISVVDSYGYTVSGLTWSSTDPSVASVSATGQVTANGSGTCTIIAVKNGMQYKTTVTVS